jgi:GT2 family glycosyltransferase
VLELGENRGPAAARNAGLAAARTPYVLALDNDVRVEADTLERLVAALEQRPDAVMAQPRSVFDSDPGRVHYDGGEFHYVGLYSLRNFYRPLAQAEGRGVVDVGGVISLALLVDREAVLALGGYDERMFILFEDLDLSYRLRLAGWALVCVEEAVVRHRAGTPGVSFREGPCYPVRRTFLHSRNRWLFLAKCYSARTLLAALPGLCAYEAVSFAFALRRGHVGAWARGKLAFLGALGSTWRLRRAVQRARVLPDRELLVGGPWTVTPDLADRPQSLRWVRRIDRWLQRTWAFMGRLSG